jgi:hypothetical protein
MTSTRPGCGCCGSRSIASAKSRGGTLTALKLEFSDVLQITSDIDLRISGFAMGEIDVALSAAGEDEEDVLPALNETEPPITASGDLWALGDHRLLCGDALAAESYVRLLGDERAQMVFSDPPWNIPIAAMYPGSVRSSTKTSPWLAAR